MKRFITLWLAVILVSVLAVTVCAADLPRFVDNAGIISDEHAAQLLEYLDEKSAELEFDIVAVIEDSINGEDVRSYADDYFDYNGFGYGYEHDGILLLIVMDTREWAFSTTGLGITIFSDGDLEQLEDAMVGELSSGNYAQGVYNYAQCAVRVVDYAKTYGYDFSTDGYYTDDYGYGYGGSVTRPRMSVGTRAGIAATVGVIAAAIAVAVMAGRMSTVHKKTAARDYIRNGSLRIYRADDVFVRKSVTRHAINTDHGSNHSSSHHGGGSFHSGSSGVSHGGRSGRF